MKTIVVNIVVDDEVDKDGVDFYKNLVWGFASSRDGIPICSMEERDATPEEVEWVEQEYNDA